MELPKTNEKKPIFTSFLFAVLLVITCNLKVSGCSCNQTPYLQAIENADEIFIGEIIKAERYYKIRSVTSLFEEDLEWGWKYYFEIKKKWKGSRNSRVILYRPGTSCDINFQPEIQYLVYARSIKNKKMASDYFSLPNLKRKNLYAHLCSRTTSERFWDKEYQKDIKRLSTSFPNEIQLKRASFHWWILGVIAICLINFLWTKKF